MEPAWCPEGHEAPSGARFCPQCAAPMSATPGLAEGDASSSNPYVSPLDERLAIAGDQSLAGAVSAPLDGVQKSQSPDDATTAAPASEPDAGWEELTMSSGAALPPAVAPRRSHRKLLVASLVVVVLAVACGGWFSLRETDDDRYLEALAGGGFQDQYATPDVALAAGHAFCGSLDNGTEPEGFDYQLVAVAELCAEYSDAFEVVPTADQLAEEYTGLLRDKGLAGKFASDATAVAHARATCRSLDDGAAQQGLEVDAVGVSVFCTEYEAGFKTLYPIKVKGSFSLMDSDPSLYYPSIEGANNDCSGTSGYSDISQGREVRVTSSSGDLLTTATLGRGNGYPPFSCEFKFSFSVLDGEEGGYMLEVGSRGSIHYSAANLKIPSTVALTLGD